jgi:hypothetical protein
MLMVVDIPKRISVFDWMLINANGVLDMFLIWRKSTNDESTHQAAMSSLSFTLPHSPHQNQLSAAPFIPTLNTRHEWRSDGHRDADCSLWETAPSRFVIYYRLLFFDYSEYGGS